eukprot:6818757-Pyramimonas_sp.AAC.1
MNARKRSALGSSRPPRRAPTSRPPRAGPARKPTSLTCLISSVKNEELPPELQKFRVRVVVQGDSVKDETAWL